MAITRILGPGPAGRLKQQWATVVGHHLYLGATGGPKVQFEIACDKPTISICYIQQK